MGGITTIINRVKYIGIASLTIAILSVLILNIISSYSNSHIQSKAEPISNSNANANLSVLANSNDSSTCNPSNTNAASCISISFLSLPNATGSTCDTSNPANVCMSIPDDGGIATGGHTVSVRTNNVAGYSLSYWADDGNDNNKEDNALINTLNSNYRIEPNEVDLDNYVAYPLNNNRWGFAIIPPNNVSFVIHPFSDEQLYIDNDSKAAYAPVFTKSIAEQDANLSVAPASPSSANGDNYHIYYGVRVDKPSELLAGNYTAQVVYTATAKEVKVPKLTAIDPPSYELGSVTSGQITITGNNLLSAYEVYLTNTNGDRAGECTNLNVVDNNSISCTIPTADIAAGSYTIHVVTQGGEDSIGFTYTEKKALSVYDSVDNVRVDYDENMIPIYYTGNSSTPRWTSLNSMQIEQNTATWFDYSGNRSNGEVKWANAVTVKDPSKYKDKSLVVDEADILGYWVYIPRYAYQVMRRDVTDQVVTDDKATAMGGFNIKFETVDDVKKTPAACASSSSYTYYFDCVSTIYPGNDEALKDKTAWATHPAFTWQYTKDINGFDQTVELNGIWVGKFETTGTAGSPTVLPNKYHLYGGNIGDYYDIAQSIGIEDPNNLYGNVESPNYNNGRGYHGLSYTTSHMLKNSEWGAVTYLASGKYGAGINNVQLNNSYRSGGTGKGPSGGAYNTADGQKASTTNNIYGVYDMAGGAWDYVMGSYTTDASQSMTNNYLSIAVKPPYVDLYVNPPFSGIDRTNNNLCTWATCGGHALYETKNVQSVSSYDQSWGGDHSNFVNSSYPWFARGGYPGNGSSAGLFGSNDGDGNTSSSNGFRVALLVNT